MIGLVTKGMVSTLSNNYRTLFKQLIATYVKQKIPINV